MITASHREHRRNYHASLEHVIDLEVPVMSGFIPRNPITGELEVIHGLNLPRSDTQADATPTFATRIRDGVLTYDCSPTLQEYLAEPEDQDLAIRMEDRIRHLISPEPTLGAENKILLASKSWLFEACSNTNNNDV
jgi:phosphoglucomutase